MSNFNGNLSVHLTLNNIQVYYNKCIDVQLRVMEYRFVNLLKNDKIVTNDYDYLNNIKKIAFTIHSCINEMYTLRKRMLEGRDYTRNKIVMWHGGKGQRDKW